VALDACPSKLTLLSTCNRNGYHLSYFFSKILLLCFVYLSFCVWFSCQESEVLTRVRKLRTHF